MWLSGLTNEKFPTGCKSPQTRPEVNPLCGTHERTKQVRPKIQMSLLLKQQVRVAVTTLQIINQSMLHSYLQCVCCGPHPTPVQLVQPAVDPLLHVQPPLQLFAVVFDSDPCLAPLLALTRRLRTAANSVHPPAHPLSRHPQPQGAPQKSGLRRFWFLKTEK